MTAYSVLGVTNARRVVAGDVGDGAEDLLGLEVAQVDPGHAAVHVVDEQPAPVVVPVRLGERRVVHVAPGEAAQHGLALVVEAVAGGRVGRVDRDGRDVAHGGHAVDVDLAGVPARREHVVLVEVPGGHVRLLRGHREVGDPRRLLRPLGRAGRAATGEEAQGGYAQDAPEDHPVAFRDHGFLLLH